MANETAIDYVPGEGDVAIDLFENGEVKKVYLKPTLSAALLLSRSGEDGPRRLADKCVQLNIDAIAIVVAAGLGKMPDDVLQTVFLTGAVNIFGPCIRFIHIVMNGGRPPKPAEDQNTGEDPLPSS